MFEKGLDILEKYDFIVEETTKGRGVLILKTDKGPKILKEYKGSGRHLKWSADILEKIDQNRLLVDSCLRNKEGEFITEGEDGGKYIIKNWYDCRDCDVKVKEDLFLAVKALAVLHNELWGYASDEVLYMARSLKDEMMGHNQEIKRIRKYLYGKNNRTEFELLATNYCDIFYEEGKNAIKELMDFNPETKLKKGLCHGNFNFHNMCFCGEVPVIMNFDKQNYNFLMMDLYTFMRKIMEKYNWDINFGFQLINEYDKYRNITDEDIRLLGILFLYPEKFWKLLNGYFNSNKAWIPRKKLDKLKCLIEQNQKRHDFIKTIYS